MARRTAPVLFLVLSAAVLLLHAFLSGCSQRHAIPTAPLGTPETELTYAPLESDTTGFRVHLYWNGYDNDGEVVRFRFAIDSDTTNAPIRWPVTTTHDSIFSFNVDPISHLQGHTFWITAEDNDGIFDPTPAKRFFSARTLPPTSRIASGPVNTSATGTTVKFSWEGTDPDGSPNGTQSPVAAFEYILLRPGHAASEGHPPLPEIEIGGRNYVTLINQSSGTSLPAPYDDWVWTRTLDLSHRFTGLVPGYCVLAVRAVDMAGARQTGLALDRNIRWFAVTSVPPGPDLTIDSNVLLSPIHPGNQIIGPDSPVNPIEVLQSQNVSFAWMATPSTSGAPVLGYSFALDDTTTSDWSDIDPTKTSTTLSSELNTGPHFLFVRAVDEDGGTTVQMVRLVVVHPDFRDDPPRALWVDDFAAPGGTPLTGAPNYPADTVDDEWWGRVLLGPLAEEFGFSFNQWDAVRRTDGLYGRAKPSLQELAQYRVVVWSVDFNNTTTSPTALWRATVGGDWSDLANYVRGGGTLIVTGFCLGNNVTGPSSTIYSNFTRGICAALPEGSTSYRRAYFPRTFMGVDGARSSEEGTRTNGARDFVGARLTSAGEALGFQSADVDTGGTGSGAKWDPYAFLGPVDNSLAPGLPKIEGWNLAAYFGCQQQPGAMRVENPGVAVAVPLFTYHGVNMGVLQESGPSRREGLVVGVATQAHDLGESDGRPVTPGDANAVMGRMVFLGFPIYYMKDEQAYAVMKAAFAYVNASPTLSSATP